MFDDLPRLPAEVASFEVRCSIGQFVMDHDDADKAPDLAAVGGKVTIVPDLKKPLRVKGATPLDDRIVGVNSLTFTLDPATGTLVHPDGTAGVHLIDPSDPSLDPQGWTYTAMVTPETGHRWTVTFSTPADGSRVVNLGALAGVDVSPGSSGNPVQEVLAARAEVAAIAEALPTQVDAYVAANADRLTGERGPEGPYGGTEVTDPQIQSIMADTGTQSGGWADVALRRSVNVLEYGATGDGIADDTQALTDALAAIAGGGTLHIGVPLRTTAEVNASMPGDAAKRIVFADGGSITADFTTRADSIINLTGSNNVHFQDAVLIGSGPGESLSTTVGIYGLTFSTSSNISVTGGSVSKTHREGLYFEDVAGVTVSGVTLSENAYSLRMGAIQLIRTSDVLVTRCTVTKSGWKGISASISDRIAITDNTLFDIAGGDAILVGGCKDFRIVSNTISGLGWASVSKAGDAIKTTEAKAGDGLASSHGVIASNSIRGIRQSGAGIRLTATQHTIVTGNEMVDVTNIGIPVASSVSLDVPIHSSDLMIVGNKLTNIGAHGIYVGPDSARVTIAGNHVDTCDPGSGVLISGGSEIVTTQNTVVRTTQPAVRYLRDDITGVARDNTTPGGETRVGPLVQCGRLEENIREVSAVRALTGTDAGAILLVSASGDLLLPEGATLDPGWNVTVKNLSSGNITVSRSGGNTIDGAASVTIAANKALRIVRRNSSVFTAI